MILLPEIGLTGEFQKKFKEFFGFNAALWHSSVTKKNKKIIWNGIATGKIKVLIGARSSLFLPFSNLGIIIVDEEHDQSYKQDEGIIYNARDMAISRASFANIPINLVTAVPSIETFNNIKKGKYSVSKLLERFKKASLPNHEIINLNNVKMDKPTVPEFDGVSLTPVFHTDIEYTIPKTNDNLIICIFIDLITSSAQDRSGKYND